eukprot:355508-Chlamydomonas_euryale.AAC.8
MAPCITPNSHTRCHAVPCVATQNKYARSMEEVVRALVDDAVGLSAQASMHSDMLEAQQQQLAETREAILRWVGRADAGLQF